MKLGISYIVFHGEELLEYTIRSIRKQVDFVCAVYQEISFNNHQARPELMETLTTLKSQGLIDKIAHYTPDFSLSYKQNEANARNVGLDASIEVSCTHHITADVDELYRPEQLGFAKSQMDGYDCSMASLEVYYKKPTWRVVPMPKQIVPLIHAVNLRCDPKAKFPTGIDASRRMNTQKCRVFTKEELVVHHMSYIRRNMREKLENTTHKYGDVGKFIDHFNNYKVGDRLNLAPDFINRRTVLAENMFNIPEDDYGCNISNGDGAGSI